MFDDTTPIEALLPELAPDPFDEPDSDQIIPLRPLDPEPQPEPLPDFLVLDDPSNTLF